ncbi:MAG TPA: prolyl oligopeptidase family serine peptidase [Longimicrobiales bacterium]
MRRLVLAAIFAVSGTAFGQGPKRPLDHDVYDIWKSIRGEAISDDGRWALYALVPGDGDGELRVRALDSATEHVIPRATGARFAEDSRFVVFTIEPMEAVVDSLRKEGKKGDALPADSLGILDLATGELVKVARVKSFALPEAAGGWVAYLLEKDTASAEPERGADEERGRAGAAGDEDDERDRDKAEGTRLVLRNLATGAEQRYEHVVSYRFSEDGSRLVYAASSKDGAADGVFAVVVANGTASALLTGEGKYTQLAVDRTGDQVAFLSNRDDYDAEQPSFTLYHWAAGDDSADALAREGTEGIPPGWWVSEHGELTFSDSGRRLYFGTAPRPAPPPDEDTLPPADERVVLDVWNWKDPYLQPMQLLRAERERERTYTAMFDLDDGRLVQLATADVPEVDIVTTRDPAVVIGSSDLPYRQLISWDGSYEDVYLVHVDTGEHERILTQHGGPPVRLSPGGRYAVWFDNQALAWFALDIEAGDVVNLTEDVPYPVYDELNDRPQPPSPYGAAGWTEGDRAFLVYDKHDIWATDPTGRSAPRNITDGVGRAENLRFRFVDLDPETDAIDPDAPLLLSAFHLWTKADGFYRDRVAGSGRPERILMQDRSFSYPRKAEDADVLLFTRESFQEFPDLWVSDLNFEGMKRISEANPQQAEYLWGTAELVEWRSVDGTRLQGILYKPEGFDPSRQYPMMVYFYERRSDTLHRHYAPAPGSSSINISFYVSRGYLVFVPDIPYQIGYPGESAVHAVIPGVLSLIDEGFVDRNAIGVQGHSWGGYQIAYMITKTDLFAAAEAGAPVANMTSAYGGIRWGSGMSRMFQYEKTQSRIGGTLWNALQRYIDNSPIFWADKVETPLLMMHNDADGAVPWYQGIEYFVSLRRLHKPVWMIVYNGEDHGLRDYVDRKDWAIRMQQFFDHFLKGAPAPVWLAEGIPAVQKGRTLGLELVTEATAKAADGSGGSR